MTEHVSEEDVRRIVAYAHIGLSSEEIPQMTADLNAIIESLKPITEYDLTGVEPTFHPIGELSNVMRDDAPAREFSAEEALLNAPMPQAGSFRVPRILGGGDA